MSTPANPPAIQQVATEVTFDVLLAAAEAAAWAVVAAYPEHALAEPRVGVDPPRDPVEAAQRVVLLADRIRDAVHRYRFLVELGVPVPEPEQEPLPF
jgi:hypothetical protein